MPKFSKFHEVVTFDAISLFTSINVPRVVDFIIDKIYANPEQYLPENDVQNVPKKNIFKEFLTGVLIKFSAFSTLNGYYRQKEGLSMGSKLSPAISNIFLNMMECIIIKNFIDQNILLFYCRYVDDCCLLVRKRYKNIIFQKMNSFDPYLKFTEVLMSDNKIIYLDTKIVKNDDSLELEQYRKTSIHSTCMMNYKQAIAPLQYKNSCLNGEIYRAKNCTTNETTLNLALQDLEQVFINNQYPKSLIKSKIDKKNSRLIQIKL